MRRLICPSWFTESPEPRKESQKPHILQLFDRDNQKMWEFAWFLFYLLNTKHRTSNTKHQISNIEYRVSNIEYRISNIEHRTSNIEYRTSNIEYRISNIEHRILNHKYFHKVVRCLSWNPRLIYNSLVLQRKFILGIRHALYCTLYYVASFSRCHRHYSSITLTDYVSM